MVAPITALPPLLRRFPPRPSPASRPPTSAARPPAAPFPPQTPEQRQKGARKLGMGVFDPVDSEYDIRFSQFLLGGLESAGGCSIAILHPPFLLNRWTEFDGSRCVGKDLFRAS